MAHIRAEFWGAVILLVMLIARGGIPWPRKRG